MEEKFKAAEFLFKKIKSLYPTFDYPDELDIDCWTDILKGYSQEDILKALKAYRKTVEYNTPPIPASFSKFLHEEAGSPKPEVISKTENTAQDPNDWHTFWNIDPALAYYMRDCATRDSKDVHGLVFYRQALRDITAELVDTLPNAKKMTPTDKIAIIRRNGWDSDISERADNLANLALGRPQTAVVGEFKQAGFALASHWRV